MDRTRNTHVFSLASPSKFDPPTKTNKLLPIFLSFFAGFGSFWYQHIYYTGIYFKQHRGNTIELQTKGNTMIWFDRLTPPYARYCKIKYCTYHTVYRFLAFSSASASHTPTLRETVSAQHYTAPHQTTGFLRQCYRSSSGMPGILECPGRSLRHHSPLTRAVRHRIGGTNAVGHDMT